MTAQIRAAGVAPSQAQALAAEALRLALAASGSPHGQWILSPHPDAASEVSWTGVLPGALTTVRVDRVFRAGLAPQSEGLDAWWIIDYKTAHAPAPGSDPTNALAKLRLLFAPQLETYAAVLRNLHGARVLIRAGLYYPSMSSLDWWEL
jgi:hypothetical protein